jgi:Spy/CpxP family protein refolding chaperone
MKTIGSKRLMATFVAVAVLSAGPAFAGGDEGKAEAQPAPRHGMGSMGGMMGGGPEGPLITRALAQRERLGLSDDQVRALEAARSDFAQEADRRQAEIEAAEGGLSGLLRESTIDLAQVEAKVREIATLRADLRLARIKTLEKGKALLTPEQRKKLLTEAGEARGTTSRRMGDGDVMIGRVRMMEMMGGMSGMMGGEDGMMHSPQAGSRGAKVGR